MSKLEHFAFFATDPATLKAFYTENLGLRVVLDNSKATPPGYFLADDSGMALEIIGRPEREKPAGTRFVCHVAFAVEDFDAARSALERAGVVFESDTIVDNHAMRTAFFNDPEGNRCQIVWRAQPLGS